MSYFAFLKQEQKRALKLSKELNDEFLNEKAVITINDKIYTDLVIEANLDQNNYEIGPNSELFYNNGKGIILSEGNVHHIIKPIKKVKEFEIDENLKVLKIDPTIGHKNQLDSNVVARFNEYEHYKIEVQEPGNYIFLFVLRNESSTLSQTSFNMYFNEIFDKTFTYGKFEDVIYPRLIKNLEIGIHTFSIKFNQSGLVFEKIIVEKHP